MTVTFVRLDPSIEPVQLVHRLCSEAHANPETKKSRYIQRMHPVTEIRKTLSVDLAAFAKEILKPHFHSGGPPKTVSARSSLGSRRSTELGKCPITNLDSREEKSTLNTADLSFSTLFGLLCEEIQSSTGTLLSRPLLMLSVPSIP